MITSLIPLPDVGWPLEYIGAVGKYWSPMIISKVRRLSYCSAGLPLPLLPVGSTKLIEAFECSELVETSGSSKSSIVGGGKSSSIRSISLISTNSEPVEEEDDEIPFSSMVRMHASISRLE